MAFLKEDVMYICVYYTCHILSSPSPLYQFVSNMIFHLTTMKANAGQSLSHVTIFIWSDHTHKVTKSEWMNPDTKSGSSCIRVEGEDNGFGNYPPIAFKNGGEALQKGVPKLIYQTDLLCSSCVHSPHPPFFLDFWCLFTFYDAPFLLFSHSTMFCVFWKVRKAICRPEYLHTLHTHPAHIFLN